MTLLFIPLSVGGAALSYTLLYLYGGLKYTDGTIIMPLLLLMHGLVYKSYGTRKAKQLRLELILRKVDPLDSQGNVPRTRRMEASQQKCFKHWVCYPSDNTLISLKSVVQIDDHLVESSG